MSRRKWGLARTFPLMLVGAIVVGAVAVGITSYMKRADLLAASTAQARLETLNGPACPELTQAEYEASGAKAKQGFASNDIHYLRRYGHVDCSVVGDGKGGNGFAPICQFSGPQVLVVTTARGTYYFRPGTGKPATVTTHDGVPACVVAGNYKG
ncbi:hypothetical protein [Phenylobacterium sp.]|uniref:hypothetical protein n=1 Tax=Phenylobacterium sp. TaxID=1871053 RepID=UPI002896D6C2|nr:hypothetical protein [Phenylobacterium sp.]